MRDVSFSPALRWWLLFTTLLLLTLGWKVAVQMNKSGSADPVFEQKVAEFLFRQHFSVAVSDKTSQGEPTIRATSGLCRMLVARSSVDGWQQDYIRQYATPEDTVFVVYRGKTYREQPTWLTASNAIWSKLRRDLGLSFWEPPVLAVIASNPCDAERLPWDEIG